MGAGPRLGFLASSPMKRKASDLRSFLQPTAAADAGHKQARPAPPAKQSRRAAALPGLGEPFSSAQNAEAERLAARLGSRAEVTYLSEDAESWLVLAKGWRPPESAAAFLDEWRAHPESFHELKMFGRICKENRWSQSWGVSYQYSGATNAARPIPEDCFLARLLADCNALLEDAPAAFNACLQNWYAPEHTIGLHADDERAHGKRSGGWWVGGWK